MKPIWMAYLLVAAGSGLAAAPVPAAGQPVASVDLADPAGDVLKFNGPGNDRDVVKLSLASDGTNLSVSATLAEDEHGTTPTSVVTLYIDSDRDAKTGGKALWGADATPPRQGYEFRGRLAVCMAWNENIGSCEGGSTVAAKSRYVGFELDKFKGSPEQEVDFERSDTVVKVAGRPPVGAPLTGRVLHGTVPYSALGVRSGQVVRISALETSGNGAAGFFPDVLLTLK
jgi:hypothetical protein